jgi:16S rRNA (cytosine1402-N4)-methyltransferase
VFAIDKDPRAVEASRAMLPGATVRRLDYADAPLDPEVVAFAPDGILLDLGVSSPQLDDERRGFTFRPGARLDMRMDPDASLTAADWLNTTAQGELAAALTEWADEPRARALSREIVRRRQHRPFAASDDLVDAIRAVLGPRSGPGDFARIFQAVRICVNQELQRLERALPLFRDLLVPGGVMAVISYHSGEDRAVKQSFREWARSCVCPPEQPVCTCRGRPLGEVLTPRPVRPDVAEATANPRSRSARLRAFRKAPA